MRSWSESKPSSCNAYPNSSIPIFRLRLLKTTPLTTPAPTPWLASPPFCAATAFPSSPLRESLLITTIGLSKPVATPSPPPQSTIYAKASFSLIRKPPLTSSIAPTAIIPSITSLSFRFALSSSRYLLHLTLSLLAYSFVSQYTARFNAEAVKNFLYSLNNGSIAKKKFNSKKFPSDWLFFNYYSVEWIPVEHFDIENYICLWTNGCELRLNWMYWKHQCGDSRVFHMKHYTIGWCIWEIDNFLDILAVAVDNLMKEFSGRVDFRRFPAKYKYDSLKPWRRNVELVGIGMASTCLQQFLVYIFPLIKSLFAV